MRRALLFAAVLSMAVAAQAATARSRVVVRVMPVETFSLAPVSAAGAQLSFVHNAAAPVKLTAECSAGMSIKSGVGDFSCVQNSARDVFTRISNGVLREAVSYSARAASSSVSSQAPGEGLTVTYTSVEE
ncbi:MAG: hypothetical protein NTX64_01070 [Elusimicrobia bacterium]|nr:hypothetical protein [Elusimicrobiota bacterium]